MRVIIFLITGVCVGLPALVWAFRLLHLHRKIRGQISAFILLLLLTDLIQLLIHLYRVTSLFIDCKHCESYKDAPPFLVLSLIGFHLHQLVALEGVLTLKYPQVYAHIFSRPCYIIISIFVIAFSIMSALSLTSVFSFSWFSLGTSLAPLCLLAVSFTITCKASSTVGKNTRSVFTVAVVTFVMLFLPFMLFMSGNMFTDKVDMSCFEISLCLMSLRVIPDPILCVLICRGSLRDVQNPETLTEPNADESELQG